MNELTFCKEDGLIVGTKYALPEGAGPAWTGARPVNGCGYLVCRRCGQTVHHLDDHRLDPNLSITDPREVLYDNPKRATSPGILPAAGYRVYFCHCAAEQSDGIKEVGLLEAYWRCGGHAR